MAALRKTIEQRFWEKVNQAGPDDCWPWTRARRSKGYGQFRIRTGESPQIASRVAWGLTYGDIPEGLVVCHKCDNPPCCNPRHLFLGTPEENTADMVAKGRHALASPAAVAELVVRVRRLTDSQIAEVRQLRSRGMSHRAIAARFDVHHSTITRLLNGRHWTSSTDSPSASKSA